MFFTRTSCAVRTGKSGILFSIPLFFLRRVCYNGAGIMKKVHSAGFRPVTFVHFCHHTPQGDVGKHYKLRCYHADGPVSHPARGRWKNPFAQEKTEEIWLITPRKGTLDVTCLLLSRNQSEQITPRKGTLEDSKYICKCTYRLTKSHPARGHRQLPRFAAQFRAVKRGGCFSVKFRAVSHWKIFQKSGRNFSYFGVFSLSNSVL